MNKQDGQEFTQLQNERQEDAEYMAQVRDLNDDKWGLTYDKQITQTLAQDSSRQVARRAGKPV